MKNEENLIVLFIIKTHILYATQCTCHLNLNFFVFLPSYRNTIIKQSAHVFSLSYFLNVINNPTCKYIYEPTYYYTTQDTLPQHVHSTSTMIHSLAGSKINFLVKAPGGNQKVFFSCQMQKAGRQKVSIKNFAADHRPKHEVIKFISKQCLQAVVFPTCERSKKHPRLALKPFNAFLLKR